MSNNDHQSPPQSIRHRVLALYKFVKIEEEKIPQLKNEIESKLRSLKTRGTILIASEGINGTICYPEELALDSEVCQENGTSSGNPKDSVIDFLQNHEYFRGLRTRLSFADTSIFHRLKVKIKKEIVTMTGDDNEKEQNDGPNQGKDHVVMKIEDDDQSENPKKKPKQEKVKVDPTEVVGTYVKPGKEWDDLLMDPDVVVIDTRNKYEIDIGTFENAISPNTDNFRYVYFLCLVSQPCLPWGTTS